jgi:DNA-binding NarL/FixJ family response regulator
VTHNTLGKSRPSAPSTDPVSRLFDLLASFASLRSDGQLLLDQIRASLEEMRELRSQLRGRQRPAKAPDGNGRPGEPMSLLKEVSLTPREIDVAMLLSQGLSNATIASELGISSHTARHHTQRILSKLEVHSRAAAGAQLRR